MKRGVDSGADHAELNGAASSFRFRPPRIGAEALGSDIVCRVRYEGREIGPLRLTDASTTGVGVTARAAVDLEPGSELDVELIDHGAVVWKGRAAVVYQAAGPSPRLGLRFSSGLFDVQRLQLRHVLVDEQLEADLRVHRQQVGALPEEWRAAVCDLAQLLQIARAVFARLDDSLALALARPDERAFIEAVFERWGPAYHAQLSRLYQLSRRLPATAFPDATGYAVRQVLSLLAPCPMHSRAHGKPRGYAGDYQLMTLYFSPDYLGSTPYARFLHCVAQHYALARTVVAREAALRDTIARAARRGPARIVALASGPAIELQRFLESEPALGGPLELVLVDQDEEALAYSHAQLTRILTSRRLAAPVNCHYLQVAVRQLLKPGNEAERRAGHEALRDADLIYSAGLFDYLPAGIARALTHELFGHLRPGGRLLISNLSEAPDTTWLMDYVLAWHLEYRGPRAMRAMAEGLPAARADVVTDATGHCMFLDLMRGE